MFFPRTQFLAAALCLLGLAGPAPAWGPEGHSVVGVIAERLLSPEAREKAEAILQGERLGDERVASWADYVRGASRYEKIYPHNDRWHYVNIDIGADREAFAFPEGTDHVAAQVKRWRRTLGRQNVRDATRREALRFLVHFVGDLHQPLHCACRGEDYGGNRMPIHSFWGDAFTAPSDDPRERQPNLHVTWDVYLVSEAMNGATAEEFAAVLLRERATRATADWREGSPEDWMWETHERARRHAYRFTDGTALPEPGVRVALTSDNYINGNLPVVREQLLKAGVRLAHLIEEAVAPLPRPGTPPGDELSPASAP